MPIPFNTRITYLVTLTAALLPFTATSQTHHRAPSTRISQPTPAAQLPVTRVSLYKNGVGFFEHAGRVTGSQAVTIDFTTAQLNDVLQSLTAIDLNGGRIAGAGYNSTTPLDQQLKALPLGLGPDPTAVDFYNAIRGARVEVHSGSVSISGRLLNIETRNTPEAENRPATEKIFITVISETGAVRTLELTPTTEVRLLDTSLHQDVTRYLQLLAGTRNQGLRHLTVQDNGTGTRDLRVSYISEVPVWKSTYRILFTDAAQPATAPLAGTQPANQTATLQGWSVVDNTTGTDWVNVQLSLIAGSPQSFIQPLSVPYYTRRAEIPLPAEAQLTPQTHESGDGKGSVGMLKEDGAPPQVAGVAGMSGMAGGSAGGVIGGVMGGIGSAPSPVVRSGRFSAGGPDRNVNGPLLPLNGRISLPDIPSSEYEQAAANSITPQTTTSAFDDYFEYKITQPITIRKNESALVPILQTPIASERVTLWSSQHPQPLRALWITNTSSLTLDRGSFTIVENGNFGGEGLLDPVHPNERRLLSYAADQAVRITSETPLNSNRVTSISAAKGVLILRRSEVAEITYLVHNAAPEPRTVILEHPVRQGFKLDGAGSGTSPDPKPEETTPTAYRFRVLAAPSQTVRLHVAERRLINSSYQLTRSDDNQLTFILNETGNNPQLIQALQPILDARRRVSETQTAVAEINQRLTALRADEDRQRSNISALKDTDKSSRQRFVNELNQSEDQLARQQKDLALRQSELQSAQQDLANKIQTLQFEQTLQP